MHPFRIFVSYTHGDEALARTAYQALADRGARPWWDKELAVGEHVVGAIKWRIETSHLLVGLITPESRNRPWVHQEIGVAIGINVPVLAIAVGAERTAMLDGDEISVQDPSDLKERLRTIELERIVYGQALRVSATPPVMHAVVDSPEDRTERIGRESQRLIDALRGGCIRQRGRLSSFAIPDAGPDETVWEQLEKEERKGRRHRQLLRDERQRFEREAVKYGCRLIVSKASGKRAVGAYRVRLETLIGFLASSSATVDILLVDNPNVRNETIVGDLLLSRALRPQSERSYQQSLLTWHAPTVLRACRTFDELFEEECRKQRLQPGDTRAATLSKLRAHLRDLGSV